MRRFCVTACLLAGCQSASGPVGKPALRPVEVEVATPVKRAVDRELELPADVLAFRQAHLYAKVSGHLRELNVDLGDRVRAGQVLARLEVPELSQDVQAARLKAEQAENDADAYSAQALAEVRQSQASVAEAARARQQAAAAAAQAEQVRAQLDLDRVTYQRLKTVYDQDAGLIARQQVDQARAAWDASRARLVSAQSNHQAALSEARSFRQRSRAEGARGQAALAQRESARSLAGSRQAEAQRALEIEQYTLLRAPFSGVVVHRYLDEGALISSGTAAILDIARTDRLRVRIQVPELNAAEVKVGTRAILSVDALPKEHFSGRVARVASSVRPEAGRSMRAELDLDNRLGKLQPGMFGRVVLALETHDGVMAVPSSGVLDEKGKLSVFCVEDGKAVKKSIQAGLRNPGWTEVSAGLNGSEKVVVKGKENLVDGAPVKLP